MFQDPFGAEIFDTRELEKNLSLVQIVWSILVREECVIFV